MSYALNEVEAMVKRAVRGSGMSWGTAEEASKAVRWLCMNGLDGTRLLARLLDHTEGKAEHDLRPAALTGAWHSASEDPQAELCPLLAGASVSDCATQLKETPIAIKAVAVPALLLPFVAAAASQLRCNVMLECDAGMAVTDGQHLRVPDGRLLEANLADVVIRCGGSVEGALAHSTRATPDLDVWSNLNSYAHKTYAPATEASRIAGAGAGLSDND